MLKKTELAQRGFIPALIENYQLLMEHKDIILADPYLRSCEVDLGFGFSYAGPVDIRLGQLLHVWEKMPAIGGKRAALLHSGGGLSGVNLSCWYNLDEQQMEEGNINYFKESGQSMGDLFRSAIHLFPKQDLYVNFPELVKQLQNPEKYPFSKQLSSTVTQFKEGIENSEAGFTQEQLDSISLYTHHGYLKLEVRVPDLSIRVKSSPGPVDYIWVKYQDLIAEIFQDLAANSGFTFDSRHPAGSEGVLSRSFNPYEGEELWAPENIKMLQSVFAEHRKGMEQLNARFS